MRSIIQRIESARKNLDDEIQTRSNLLSALSISQELDLLIADYIETSESKKLNVEHK